MDEKQLADRGRVCVWAGGEAGRGMVVINTTRRGGDVSERLERLERLELIVMLAVRLNYHIGALQSVLDQGIRVSEYQSIRDQGSGSRRGGETRSQCFSDLCMFSTRLMV